MAHKNGALQTNLNADKVDGYDVGTTAGTIPVYDANGNMPVTSLVTKGIHNPNLLFNSNWKYGSIGWSGIGSNGFSLNYGVNGETEYISNGTSNTAVCIQTVPNIPIGGGLPITLSAEMFCGATSGIFYVQIRFWNSSNVQVGAFNLNATLGTGWTKYSGTGVTPTGTAYADVRLVQDGTVVNTNSAWRKIKVEYSPFATAYSDDSTLDLRQYANYQPFVQSMGSLTGLKVQTGVSSVTIATAGAGVLITVTFPIAFTASPLVLTTPAGISGGDSGYLNIRISSISANSVTFACNSYIAQALVFNWIAIGN